MHTVKISPLGVTGGAVGGNGGQHGTRQNINGWTIQSARGNTRFLRSVVVDQLPRYGLAFTFTIRDMPTPGQWKQLQLQLKRALRERFGCVCWHMVTEWTRKGRPHLHGCAFWLDYHWTLEWDLEDAWLAFTKSYGTLEHAQHVKRVKGADGWFIYMAKHASRGMAHYQREAENLPPEWQQKTGRVWSHGGRWPTEIQDNEVTDAEFFRFRRVMDRHARSEALTSLKRALKYGDPAQIKGTRKRLAFLRRLRMAFGEGRTASSVRGISQWVPGEVSSKLLRWAIEQEPRPSPDEAVAASLEAHGLSKAEVPF